jgi:protein-tyrosine kinase
MERIQEAIEKARRERQGNIGSAQGSEVEPKAESLSPNKEIKSPVAEPVQKKSSSDASASIRVKYSQTRTVKLNDDELKDRRIVAGFAHDKRSEPYRQLRGQILNKFRQNNWQTLAITSPNSGGGRTLTAMNLAISLSLEVNQTVLLVDLDLRQPGVASCIGVDDVEYGIVDYVNGTQNLESILIHPGFERLVLLPGTPQGAFTSEILSSPEMKSVKDELVARYPGRLIIFDLPSVLSHDDALVFAPGCDATLMVIEEGGTKKKEIERAYQLLDGCNIIGSVLNKVKYL